MISKSKLTLRYSVGADAGLDNGDIEEVAYAGPHLLAVADIFADIPSEGVLGPLIAHGFQALDVEAASSELRVVIDDGIRRINSQIHRRAQDNPDLRGMGTSLTALLYSGSDAVLAHIGDTRAYLERNNKLTRITKDHTYAQALLDDGGASKEEMFAHPHRRTLWRWIDGRQEFELDFSIIKMNLGDRYLICSGGIWDSMVDDSFHSILATARDPRAAVSEILRLKKEARRQVSGSCVVAEVVNAPLVSDRVRQAPVVAGVISLGHFNRLTR